MILIPTTKSDETNGMYVKTFLNQHMKKSTIIMTTTTTTTTTTHTQN